MSSANIPHLAVPFRIDGTGTAAVVEQDSVDDVAQCVETLLRTFVGERLELPDYGIEDPTFETVVPVNELMAVVARWEPRAVTFVEQYPDRFDEMVQRLNINVVGVA